MTSPRLSRQKVAVKACDWCLKKRAVGQCKGCQEGGDFVCRQCHVKYYPGLEWVREVARWWVPKPTRKAKERKGAGK